MIEKLDRTLRQERDSDFTISETVSIGEMQEKINELVDAVNELQKNATISKMEKVEPADPYAEQRKWIGKLCKFWFADAEHPTFGILDFVDAGPHPEPFHINCGESEQGWFPHCEPVKPDDDIIYKGE